MELLILLIVILLLAGLILGPIGFFRAAAAANAVAGMERQMDRLADDLRETRTLCFKLRAVYAAAEAAPDAAGESEPNVAVEEVPPGEAVEPTEEDGPAVGAPTNEASTTLERLRELRQAGQQQEPAVEEQAPPADEGPEASAEPVATAEPSGPDTPPVTVLAPVEPEPYEPAPARRLTIEEVLAGKVFVWIGAIALVLTAAFLLKLGFDSGVITEPVRVIAAGVFGVVLWCVGEWARSRVGLISQALCGAAVAVLYGTVLAADYYSLLGSGSALPFGLMATITAAAVALSLRHGPAVAILGMLGGFMLPPLLVQDYSPNLGMILYLLAIEIGVLAVTGKRGWFGISAMTLVFTVAWSLGYTLIGDNPTERTLTAMLVIGTAGAYLFHTARIHRDPAATPGTRRRVLGLSIAATCSAIGVVALLAVSGGYNTQDLGMLWLVAAGTLVLARLDARQLAMPFVAMGLSLLVLFANALRSIPAPPTDTLIALAACFGGLFLAGGYLCMWASPHRRVFAAMAAIAGPGFYGLVVFAGHDALGWRDAWWPYTLSLAGAYALAAVPMLLKRKSEHDWPIALFAVLGFTLVCVTLLQSLNHPRLAVCLALVAAVAALIDLRLYIRPLRVAGCVAAGAAAVLLVVPGPFDLTIRGVAVFNTLLPMYALPALSFGVIAWCAAQAGSGGTARRMAWLCIATVTAMLLALTRQAFQPDDFMAQAFGLYEWSTYAGVLLLAAYAGSFLARRLQYEPILAATRCIVGLGAAVALIAGLAPSNPLVNGGTAGGVELAAGLLALYALPAALMWHWSRHQAIAALPQLANALRVIAITLTALFVGLQVRNGFQPDGLRSNPVTLFECITYATAWLVLGGFIQRLNQQHLQSTATRAAGRIIFGIGLLTTLIGSVIVFNPLFNTDEAGGLGLLPRLATLYVLPAVILWLWSRSKTLADQTGLTSTLRATSIAYLAIFVGQVIRNAFHADDLRAIDIGVFECATYGLAWAALGFFFHFFSPRSKLHQTTGQTGRTVFGIGLIMLLLGNVVVLNPLWFRESVGNVPVFNGLWYLFGPTILILALIARQARHHGRALQAKLAGFTAIAIAFMLLSMFIRHGFSGDGLVLIAGTLEPAERYAYSLAWVLFGGALLVAGVFTRLDTLRYGSLAVLLLAVGKVFLIDTANLDNLYRVFSFFGLGVTLVALGYLYQRLVFKRPTHPHKMQAS